MSAVDGHLGEFEPVVDGMEEPMTEEYRKFDPADYIKTTKDVQGLLDASADEDPGDGVVIRAVLKYIAQRHRSS